MTVLTMLDRAVRNNADWCDLVCRTHGARTCFDDHAWTSATRTPPLYPDAITLQRETLPEHLMSSIDASQGCSIKDSFATLDLQPHGFHVMFEGRWIASAPSRSVPDDDTSASDVCWAIEQRPDQMDDWCRAWSAAERQPSPFVADLLAHEHVTVLAARANGRPTAGALLFRGAGVLAISNFFSADTDVGSDTDTLQQWCTCLAAARSTHPGWTVVGYESGRRLSAALHSGFDALGPLRVWVDD